MAGGRASQEVTKKIPNKYPSVFKAKTEGYNSPHIGCCVKFNFKWQVCCVKLNLKGHH